MKCLELRLSYVLNHTTVDYIYLTEDEFESYEPNGYTWKLDGCNEVDVNEDEFNRNRRRHGYTGKS